MKISNLSPQINFAKVIEIEKDRRDEIHMWNGFEAEQTIADVLNGKKSQRVAQKYTEKDEQKIKKFFTYFFHIFTGIISKDCHFLILFLIQMSNFIFIRQKKI